MEEISVDHSREGMWPMVGLGALMFGASLWLLYAGLFTNFRLPQLGPATGPFSIVVGSIGVLFFGYAFFYILSRALFPKGALIINEEGIIDQTTAIGSKEVIPFDQMKEAKLEMVQSTAHIGIELINEQAYLNRLPWIKRTAKRLNKKYFGTSTISMNVPVDSRDHLKELIAIINERREFVQEHKEA